MKQTQAFLSTYTADVSGVCSALFELRGMTVMHDPSGCNSTYNTHDEPRWYDTDSLVFISGLSEIEAIMGDDEKLINDIIDAANQLHPEFIAIAGTPIPMMVGTDMAAIACEIEAASKIPTFAINTNGMHSYISGAGAALAAYASRMLPENPGEKLPDSINILGVTPLDFSVNGSVSSIKKLFLNKGIKVLSSWAMGSTPEELKQAGRAAVNLVVSTTGLQAARLLKEKYGTPFVIGAPFGNKFSEKLISCIKNSEKTGESINALEDFMAVSNRSGSSNQKLLESISAKADSKPEIAIIGEAITSRSLATAIYLEYGKAARVISPIETDAELLSKADVLLTEECDIQENLKTARVIIADPLYKRIAPKNSVFYELPHEAYSGRCFRSNIPNLVERLSLNNLTK